MASSQQRKKILRKVDKNIMGKLDTIQEDILAITEFYGEGGVDALHLSSQFMMLHQGIEELKSAFKHIRKNM